MKKIMFLALWACAAQVFAQTNISRSLWSGNSSTHVMDLGFSSDTTVSLVGYAMSPTTLTQNDDIYITLTNKLTHVKKAMLIGDSMFEFGRAHLIDKQGDVLLVGTTRLTRYSNQATGLLIKMDANWNIRWSKKITLGAYTTDPQFCKQLRDGNYLIGGVTKYTWDDVKGWICKMDTAGNVMWCKTYTRNSGGFNSMEEDPQGNLYATGYQFAGNSTGFVLKLNSSGNIIWDGSVLGWQYLAGKLGKDGNLYVVGEAGSNSSVHGFMIQKYNASNGSRVWVRKYNTYLGGHIAFDLCFDEKGLMYVLGTGTSSDSKTHLFKMKTNGDLIKHVTISPSNVLANFRDNQSILYDTLYHRLWISSTSAEYSQENYLFMVDTGLSNTNCLIDRLFPLDTSMVTGVSGGELQTTVVTITPTIQSIVLPSRLITIGSSISCLGCSPNFIGYTYKHSDTATVAFTNTSDTSTGRTFRWTFGDGNTSTLKNPTHTYNSKGTFQVKLVATSLNGICKDSVTMSVKIEGKPVARFTAPNACFYSPITFTNQSVVSPGTITKRYWYFGNGDTSTLSSPVYRYTAPGQYMVKLVVETETGRKDSVQKLIVAHPKPVANYAYALSCQKDTTHFTNTSTVSTGNVTNAIWTYGIKTVNGLHAKIVFPDTGHYQLRMICISDSLCRDTIIRTVAVKARPIVGFTLIGLASQCFRNNIFSFIDTTRFAGTNLTSYWITPSDTVTGLTMTRSFGVGTHQIKRTASSQDGCKDSAIKWIKVFEQPTLPLVIGDNYPLKNSVKTYKVNRKMKSTYQWFLSGGTILTGQGTDTLSIQWSAQAGPGLIRVLERDSNGCYSDTARLEVNITSYRFEVSPDSIIASSGASTGHVITILSDTSWTGSTTQSWIHLLPASGTGNASATVSIDSNTGVARQGSITFTSGLINRTVMVTQAGTTPVGYAEINEKTNAIRVYPNPGRDLFTVVFDGLLQPKKITLTDLCGKEVIASFTEDGNNFTFSASHMKAGLYLLQIECNQQVYFTKVLVSE